MNHAITLRDVAIGLGLLVGIVTAGGGVLMIFAGGMSDAPEAGDSVSSQGCLVLLGGAFLLLACLGAIL